MAVPILDKPLLRRTVFEPGESLPSLLARLALLNHYSPPSILERVTLAAAPADWKDSIDCPGHLAIFERLALLTGLPPFELYQASDHRFLPMAPMKQAALRERQLPDWVGPARTQQLIHPSAASQFCPHCLREEAYHRLQWRPIAITRCLTHHALLTALCFHCQAPVDIRSVVEARCHKCGGNLNTPPTNVPAGEEWDDLVQQTLWAWLLGETQPAPGCEWPQQPPDVLYRLAEVFAFGMLTAPQRFASLTSPWPPPLQPMERPETVRRCSPGELCWAYTHALRWMSDWPEGFREFLYRLAPERDEPLDHALGYFFSRGLNPWFQHRSGDFVRLPYEQFEEDRKRFSSPAPIPVWQCISLEETSRLLKLDGETLLRLAQVGELELFSHKDYCLSRHFFRRSVIFRLQAEWKTPLTLDEAARWLGTEPGLLQRLLHAGLLRGQRSPDKGKWLFTKTAVARFLRRVNTMVWEMPSVPMDHGLTLAEAAHHLAGVGWNEVRILRALLARTLPAHREPAEEELAVRSIRFALRDLENCAQSTMRQQDWASIHFAASFFLVDEGGIQQWVELGLLKPTGHFPPEQPVFSMTALEKLKPDVISFDEARRILQLGRAVLLRRIAQGKIKPIYISPYPDCLYYLFLRPQIEKLAQRRKGPRL